MQGHYDLGGGDIACSLGDLNGMIGSCGGVYDSADIGIIGVEHTAEHNEHYENHKKIRLLTLGKSVEETKEREH